MSYAVFQGIGVTELLIVLGIVLLIFGPKRLPMLGRQLGRGMREFKDSVTKRHDRDDEDRPAIATAAAPAEPETVSGEVVRERREP